MSNLVPKSLMIVSRYCLLSIGFVLALAFNTSRAQEQSQSAFVMTVEEARGVFSKKLSDTATKKEKNRFYRERFWASKVLDDLSAQEKTLRAWIEATNSDEPFNKLGYLLVFQTDRIQEGLDILHKQLEKLERKKNIPSYIFQANKLIEIYSSLRLINKAKELISTVENYLKLSESYAENDERIEYFLTSAKARFLSAKAGHHWRVANFDEALASSKESIKVFGVLSKLGGNSVDSTERVSDEGEHRKAFLRLANIYISLGNLYQAEAAIREGYQLSFDGRGANGLRRVAARLKSRQGDYQGALEMLQQNLLDFEKRGHSNKAQHVLWHRRDLKAQFAGLARWTELLREFTTDDSLAQNDKILKRLVWQGDLRWLAYFFNGRINEAAEVNRKRLERSVEILGSDHPVTNVIRGSLAVALASLNDQASSAEAISLFQQAFVGLTDSGKIPLNQESPFDSWLKSLIFESYIQLLLKSPETIQNSEKAEIFSVATHNSGSSVQKAITDATARTRINDPVLAELVRKDQDAARELEALYDFVSGSNEESKQLPEVMKALDQRIRALEGQRRSYKLAIEKQFPSFAQLVAPKPVSLKQLQAKLKPSEAFLSVTSFKSGFLSFLVTKEGFSMSVPNITQAQATREVDRMRTTLDVAGLGRRAPVFDFKASFSIYDQVVAPHETYLKGKTELIVSAFGALAQFPFAVLVDSNWQGREYTEAPWLAKRFAISYTTSPTAWLAVKAFSSTPAGSRPLIAWGDPLYKVSNRVDTASPTSVNAGLNTASNALRSRSMAITRNTPVRDLTQPIVNVVVYDNLPPLPETRDEVFALAKVLNADPTKDIIVGPDATRESVLKASETGELKERSVVVFATHGLIPGDLPSLTQPALAMSGAVDASRSPLLTLDDVLSLKLNADWVVLSACNTAAADGKAQEALSGLARGFFYAGSRSLLVTHWSVESESATLLTTRTFQAHREGHGLTRGQALNRAMLSVMNEKKFSHPAFWAPYVLVGEGGR